jgi:hypothetical protein
MIQFWIGEVRRGYQDFHDENHMRRFPLDNFDTKILVILNKSPFQSIRSIAETFHVSLTISYGVHMTPLFQIVPFVLGTTCIDDRIARETNGVCTGHPALLACC